LWITRYSPPSSSCGIIHSHTAERIKISYALGEEIKHRISKTRKVINALNSIWWQKNITKNRKLYIYQTIIQSILVYGVEVWQIPTREINKILSTEMNVLRRSARKSRMERIKNEHIRK
jgi:hypothetical protein